MLSRSLTRLVVWLLLSVAFAQSLAAPHVHGRDAVSGTASAAVVAFQEATEAAASGEDHEGEVECRCQWCSPYLHAALAYDTRPPLPVVRRSVAPSLAALTAPAAREPWTRPQPRGPPVRRLALA